MRDYILKRLLLIVPTLLGISLASFLLLQFVPGGPVEQALQSIRSAARESGGGQNVRSITQEEVEYIKRHYGFDKPLVTRYLLWLGQICRFNFGESYQYQEPVVAVILERFPISLTFGLISFFLTYLVCIPLGIAKALRHRTRFDNLTSALIFIAYAIPGFALGVLLLSVFAGGGFLSVFPLSGAVSDNFEDLPVILKILDFSWHMILPVTCYVIGNFAVLTILMKNSLIEELNRDYIRTAQAKGLPFLQVVLRHALRNALIPIATGFGKILTVIFAGSLLIETVFNINGIGLLSYESMVNRDYPMVMGILIIESFLILVGNLLSDVSYVIIDPRINFAK